MARRLGTILVDMGYLDEEKLWNLLEEQKRSDNELIGKVATRLGLVTDEQLRSALDKQRQLGGQEQIGDVLVSMGLITERDKIRALGEQWEERPTRSNRCSVRTSSRSPLTISNRQLPH